jgi:peroxidase
MVMIHIFLTVMVVGGVSLFPETAEAIVMGPSMQKLTWHYYKVYNTCENAENFVRHQVEIFYKNDKSIAPKLLRLLYSDCFVSGCDASVLLEGPNSEKMAPQNRGLGGFVLIDKIKIVLEQRCPGVVSCADILNLATRDAVHLAGAPSYPVFTGRRDGLTSDKQTVDLPSPSISWDQAMSYFKSRGLNVLDMATLLGQSPFFFLPIS